MGEDSGIAWFSGTGPWLSAGFVALMGFWMLGAFNRLMRLRNAVVQAWAPVQAQLDRRAEALPDLVTALREPLASEHRALDTVLERQSAVQAASLGFRTAFKAVRRRAEPVQAAQALVQALSALDAALARLLALMEQHSELRSQAEVSALKRELHDADLRLAIARQNFNDAASVHDEAVLQWPTQALARLYGFALAGRL